MSATRPATELSIGIMRELGAAVTDGGERVLEGRAREWLVAAISLVAGDMRIGARLALEGDLSCVAS